MNRAEGVRSRWRGRVAAPVALAILAVLPLAIAWAFGAMGLPRNDDWSYSEILWRWADTGVLRPNGYEGMSLVGQLAAAWPVGRLLPGNETALQIFTAVLGVIGVLACYATVRRFLPTSRAFLAAAVVLISPVYAPVAASFMTDVPAFAMQAVCAWLGTAALSSAPARRRVLLLTGSIVVGVVGATIREYALVAPATILLVSSLRAWGRRDRTVLSASAALWVVMFATFAVFSSWRRGWKGSFNFSPTVPASLSDGLSSVGRSLLFTVVTLAFLVLPSLAFVPWRRLIDMIAARQWAVVASVAAVVVGLLGVVATWEWSPPLLGPYLDQRGALGNDILRGDRALLLPGWLLTPLLVITLLASIGLVSIFASTAARFVVARASWRERCAAVDAVTFAWLFVVLTVLGLTAAGAADLPLFDRYVMPAVPFAAGLVLAWDVRAQRLTRLTASTALRWAAVGAFALLGLTWSADSAGFDAARWRAGQRAVDLGYAADRVDAGFEWRNFHRLAGQPATSPFQADPDACVIVTGPDPDLGPDATPLLTVEHWHGTTFETLTVWDVAGQDCPPLP